MDRKMATRRDKHFTRSRHKSLHFESDPNDTPYNSVSTFKNFDETVVSAYEVARGHQSKKLVKSQSVSDLRSVVDKVSNKVKSTCESVKAKLSSSDVKTHRNPDPTAKVVDERNQKSHRHNGTARIRPRPSIGVPQLPKEFGQEEINTLTTGTSDEQLCHSNITIKKANTSQLDLQKSNNENSTNGKSIVAVQSPHKVDSNTVTTTGGSSRSEKRSVKKLPSDSGTASPNHKHLVLPGNDTSSSGNLLTVNRRKLPKVPNQKSPVPVPKVMHSDKVDDKKEETTSLDLKAQHGPRMEKCDNYSLESVKMCADAKSADEMHFRSNGCELRTENVSFHDKVDRAHQQVCDVYLENANAKLKTKIVSKMASMQVNDEKKTPGNISTKSSCATRSCNTNSSVELKGEGESVKYKHNVDKQQLEEKQKLQDFQFDRNSSNFSVISNEFDELSDENLDPLSQSLPRHFTFDMNVIQELTDGVMCKSETKANHDNKRIEEQHNDSVSTVMPASISATLDKKNSDKLIIEGMSVFGKNKETVNENGVEETGQMSTQKESLSNNGVSLLSDDNDSTGKNKALSQARNVKVERTPSYRRKVMARVNSRYSKKSKNCKECSCMRKENGEIEVCSFCENYENLKKRSQSCLGHIALSDIGTEEYDSCNSDIPSPRRAFTPGLSAVDTNSEAVVTGSPQPIKKVQVSPRVDILMSSNLFKKHLLKHEHLLNKHTTSYRKLGMKKAVSNLDISEGFVADNSSENEHEIHSGVVNSKGDTPNSHLLPNDQNCARVLNRSRRYSLTGDSDSSIENYAIKERTKRQQVFGTIPKSLTNTRSRPPIPTFSDSRKNKAASYQIPSYHEFKKQKELYKGTAMNLNENENDIRDKVNVTNDEHFDKTKRTRANSAVLQSTYHSENESVGDRCDKTYVNEISETESEKINSKLNSEDLRSEPILQHMKLPQERDQSINKEKRGKRIRPKLKARTLSRIEFEADDLGSVSGSSDFGSASPRSPHGRHRTASKRPRSLISKKSSLISLIQESESKKGQENENRDKRNESPDERTSKHAEHPVNRSESDSKYETNKGRNSSELYLNQQSRVLTKRDKGRNSVSFDLDDSSQCSTQDVGESDTSTSIAGSMSDSLHSESVSYDEFGRLPATARDDADEDSDSRLKPGKDDCMAQVLRSTSDACEITPEAARKRRERKERPYKSDPFSGTEILPASKRCLLREERAKMRMIQQEGFSSSSREEILSFLDCVSSSMMPDCDSFPSLEELNEDDEQALICGHQLNEGSRRVRKHLSNVSSLSTDSGVIGQDGSHDSQQSSPSNTLTYSMSEKRISQWEGAGNEVRRSMSASCGDLRKKELHECQDCGQLEQFDLRCMTQICPQCYHRRIERKKTIQEIVDTEMNYGRDLMILKEEFYVPMKKATLLSQEQLDCIFLNLDELTHVNKHFISKLKSSINTANHQNDEDLRSVMIGTLFLESSTMFLTFENYCVNQAQAPLLLEQLEREKELLRIFLNVSQNDNTLLRRMHLKSFLMVPVQRIMKYPLLLDRLYRTTVPSHPDKEALKEAKEKIEDILGNINARSKGTNLKHRKSEKHYSVTEKMEVSRVALETLKWNRKDVCDVITSKLLVTQPVDHLWATKKCKNYKFTTVHGVLLSLLQPTTFDNERDTSISNDNNNNNNNNGNNNSNSNNMKIQSAAVVLIKEKNGKYQVLREPFMLDKCVVSQDPDFTDVFEILEWNKESYLIKAEKPHETALWVQNLRQQMRNLGCWRRRRNALPNILLNHLS